MDSPIVTGNGASAPPMLASAAASVGEPTAENSSSSERRGKRNTGKRAEAAENLSDQEILAILENALKRIRLRWEPAKVVVTGKLPYAVALGLPAPIAYCHTCQHLRMDYEMNGSVCQHCKPVTGKEKTDDDPGAAYGEEIFPRK